MLKVTHMSYSKGRFACFHVYRGRFACFHVTGVTLKCVWRVISVPVVSPRRPVRPLTVRHSPPWPQVTKKEVTRLERHRRAFKERERRAKMQRAVQISIEGRKMAL